MKRLALLIATVLAAVLLPTVPAQAVDAASISGRVTFQGYSISDITVTAHRFVGGVSVATYTDVSDGAGDFVVAALPAGVYRVEFAQLQPGAFLPVQRYQATAADPRGATITIAANQARTGVDSDLYAATRISSAIQCVDCGTTFDPADVVWILQGNDGNGGGWVTLRNAAGVYFDHQFVDLVPGQYRVRIAYSGPLCYVEHVSSTIVVTSGAEPNHIAWLTKTVSQPTPFADVPTDHAFRAEIEYLLSTGVTNGYIEPGSGLRTYHPDESVTRQAMAAFLYRLYGGSTFQAPTNASFSDVPTTHPFFREIEWMKAAGVTNGYLNPGGSPSFHPVEPVSRQAMAAFLYRVVGSPAFIPPATATFNDVSTSALFAKEIEWLKATGIANGYVDGGFHPIEDVSRQAMAAFLYRLVSV